MTLAATIEALFALASLEGREAEARAAVAELRAALNAGSARAAEPDGAGGWRVNAWVKQGILLAFRVGEPHAMDGFVDKDTLPARAFSERDGVRLVPGGSSVRDGAHLAPGVICMPPVFVNIGAWIGAGAMLDSHALVGSCAQIGAGVHVSAAAQIGGVLEPINAAPVIVEEGALIGGNCGIYEGTRVGHEAVLGAGVILTRSTPLYDLVHGTVHRAGPEGVLVVPPRAVVVAGARAVTAGPGPAWGLSLYTPVIVKYRDTRTDAAVELERWLR